MFHHLRLQTLQILCIGLLHRHHGFFKALNTSGQDVKLSEPGKRVLHRGDLRRQGVHLYGRGFATRGRGVRGILDRAWTVVGRRIDGRRRTREKGVYVIL